MKKITTYIRDWIVIPTIKISKRYFLTSNYKHALSLVLGKKIFDLIITMN